MAMSVRRTARRLPASRLATAIAIAALALSLLPEIGATAARSPSIASIRYIYHGLTVQPPHAGPRPGRVRQSLFASYYLQTLAQQKASLTFADRTVLHMNQRTDVVLKSPHLTVLKSGEVEELDAPGTNHEIQTDAA
ncbi:MAG TPA: hypothetical protein VKX16_11815, partial [Chloroflexota bacterium]|nr:hypothetical protein [Chloroflexota bacterium]